MTRHRAVTVLAWTAVTAVALIILATRIIPGASRHRGQIHTTVDQLTMCVAQAQRPSDGRVPTLQHLADCAQDNKHIRHDLGDELSSALVLGVAVVGGRRLAAEARPTS